MKKNEEGEEDASVANKKGNANKETNPCFCLPPFSSLFFFLFFIYFHCISSCPVSRPQRNPRTFRVGHHGGVELHERAAAHNGLERHVQRRPGHARRQACLAAPHSGFYWCRPVPRKEDKVHAVHSVPGAALTGGVRVRGGCGRPGPGRRACTSRATPHAGREGCRAKEENPPLDVDQRDAFPQVAGRPKISEVC